MGWENIYKHSTGGTCNKSTRTVTTLQAKPGDSSSLSGWTASEIGEWNQKPEKDIAERLADGGGWLCDAILLCSGMNGPFHIPEHLSCDERDFLVFDGGKRYLTESP